MPSAKFTESEVLEPSESFCEREKISEVEADLRAYFAWEIGKPLPGWIYDKLDMFPHAVFYPFSAQPQAALMSRSAACMTL